MKLSWTKLLRGSQLQKCLQRRSFNWSLQRHEISSRKSFDDFDIFSFNYIQIFYIFPLIIYIFLISIPLIIYIFLIYLPLSIYKYIIFSHSCTYFSKLLSLQRKSFNWSLQRHDIFHVLLQSPLFAMQFIQLVFTKVTVQLELRSSYHVFHKFSVSPPISPSFLTGPSSIQSYQKLIFCHHFFLLSPVFCLLLTASFHWSSIQIYQILKYHDMILRFQRYKTRLTRDPSHPFCWSFSLSPYFSLFFCNSFFFPWSSL